MKKFLFILSALALLGSCQKTGVSYDEAPQDIFASIDGSSTKVTFGSLSTAGQYPHVWEQSDDISVFYKSDENMLYRNASTGAAGGYARFMQSGYSVSPETKTPLSSCYAIYPYDEGNKVGEDGTYYFKVSDNQIYRQGTYGSTTTSTGTYASIVLLGRHDNGTSTDENYFNFYNAGCFLRLPIKLGTGSDPVNVTKVILKSNTDSDKIAGKATATFPSSVPSVKASTEAGDCKNTITLDCSAQNGGKGVALTGTEQDFYIFLLPADFNNGFTVSLYDGETLKALAEAPQPKVNGQSAFQRNRVVRMSPLSVNPAKIKININVVGWSDGGTSVITP